ncbi:MAG: hypothetical protein IK103_03885 [Bacteroidales bacterium]|nr:hypothetical protein [Bacteroidales bacterium]
MIKKLFCAALMALAVAACSKDEAAKSAESQEKATIHLNVSPYEIVTKNTDPRHGEKKYLDSVSVVDVFVFREGGALDAYKHFSINSTSGMNLSNLPVDATVGNKTIYVVANSKETSWAGVVREENFLNLVVSLQKEYLPYFTMTGKVTVNVQNDQVVNIVLKRLVAKVVVKGIKTDFAGTPYEGMKLKYVKLYLTNIAGAKTYMGEDPSTKVILNSKGYSQEDYSGCLMTAMFAEGVPGLVGDDGYTTVHHFYCYENLMDTETDTDRFTRLVLEAELDGTVYYYPVDINQPGYGWTSSVGHKGVKRNTCYTYTFTITGPGSDDPESKITLKTVTLNASVENMATSPNYSVSF